MGEASILYLIKEEGHASSSSSSSSSLLKSTTHSISSSLHLLIYKPALLFPFRSYLLHASFFYLSIPIPTHCVSPLSSARDKLLSVIVDAKPTTNHASHKFTSHPRCLGRNPLQRCVPNLCNRELFQSPSSGHRVSSEQWYLRCS